MNNSEHLPIPKGGMGIIMDFTEEATVVEVYTRGLEDLPEDERIGKLAFVLGAADIIMDDDAIAVIMNTGLSMLLDKGITALDDEGNHIWVYEREQADEEDPHGLRNMDVEGRA